jgi:hypothetical protein
MFAALVCLASVVAAADYRGDAETWLYMAQRRGLDPAGPLDWWYSIEHVPAGELDGLRAALRGIGITGFHVPEEDELNDAGWYSLWLEETRAHRSVDDLAAHVANIAAIARRHRASLESWVVDLPKEEK